MARCLADVRSVCVCPVRTACSATWTTPPATICTAASEIESAPGASAMASNSTRSIQATRSRRKGRPRGPRLSTSMNTRWAAAGLAATSTASARASRQGRRVASRCARRAGGARHRAGGSRARRSRRRSPAAARPCRGRARRGRAWRPALRRRCHGSSCRRGRWRPHGPPAPPAAARDDGVPVPQAPRRWSRGATGLGSGGLVPAIAALDDREMRVETPRPGVQLGIL